MNRLATLRIVAVAGLSLLTACSITRFRRGRQASSHPHGRYTLNQILQRSLPLSGALASHCESLKLVGSPLVTWDMGRSIPIWTVDGVDAQDGLTIHLVWDADSGELIAAVRSADKVTSVNAKAVLTPTDAQRLTSSWLTTLGMSELATGWRAGSTTYNPDFCWRVEWWTDTRGAVVTIDSRTGELRTAVTKKPACETEQRRTAQARAMAALGRQ